MGDTRGMPTRERSPNSLALHMGPICGQPVRFQLPPRTLLFYPSSLYPCSCLSHLHVLAGAAALASISWARLMFEGSAQVCSARTTLP